MSGPFPNRTRGDWITRARDELIHARIETGTWSYRAGGTDSVEPSVLGALALRGLGTELSEGDQSHNERLASWLVSIQNKDGSIGLSGAQRSPGWPTSYALLLWHELKRAEGCRRSAVRWLLGQKGRTIRPEFNLDRTIGHDTMLVGWPWVTDTHSWLEPTALAVLALRKEGAGNNTRVLEGLKLIRDRAIPGGGWNYGNKAAFGTALRPQPAPTGLALLALADSEGERTQIVSEAIRYLRAILPKTRSPFALGWGLLGLAAWNDRPTEANTWLAESFDQVTGRSDAPIRLALLLLAAGSHSIATFRDN